MANVSKPRKLKNGDISYRLYESKGFDSNGKHNRETETVRIPAGTPARERKRILQEKKRDFENRIRKGISIENPPYKEFCSKYMEHARNTLKQKSVENMGAWLKHSIKEMGDIRIKDIKKTDIRKFIDTLKKKGYRPTTIRNYYKAVSVVLSYACEIDYLENNPCIGKGIKLPESRRKDKGYTTEELHTILKDIDEKAPLRYKTYFNIIALTGAREGEICGLKWENIDLENKTITIEETATDSSEKGLIFGTPKTSSSRRTIPISQKCTDLLRQLKKEQNIKRLELGFAWLRNPLDTKEKFCENHGNCGIKNGYCSHICKNMKNSDRVFVLDNGIPEHPQGVYKWYKRFLKYNNLPNGTVHGFRHACVSQLYRNGVEISDISRYVGHASPAITLDIYAESLTDSMPDMADIMAKVIEN